ncbi:hypothetical protein ASD04_04975 [Devosia sp. Root436]|nr:hypothetical protein ASD04_04975 [Devosia sp. Root436]
MIAQPARELKNLQYFLIDRTLSKLPVHSAAAAYRENVGIRSNAAAHARNEVILKLDFSDFFPSIKPRDWMLFCGSLDPEVAEASGLATGADVMLATRLLFWGRGTFEPKCLSIGAPSSPVLSNVLMFAFDTAVAAHAIQNDVVYTRYADDITLSSDRSKQILLVEAAIRRYIKRYRSPALTINEEKRGLYTSGQKKMVTGLVVTPEKRVSLGRDRKRMISSLVHRFTLTQLELPKIAYLQGMLAFARDVEPSFYASLERKYGQPTMRALLAFRLPKS